MHSPLARLGLAAAASLALASPALAAPYNPFDVRATAMGGTGVASTRAASAALFNPAMLSAQRDDDSFQFQLGLGAQEQDAQHMFDETDALKNLFQDFNTALAASNQPQIKSDAQALEQKLAAINGETLMLGAGANLAFGLPGKKIGVGVVGSANAFADTVPHIAAYDLNNLNNFAAQGSLACTPSICPNYTPQSTAEATGVVIGETGIGLSHRFDLSSGGLLAVGATPKIIDVSTYHYEQLLNNFSSGDIKSAANRSVGNHADLDIGIAWRPDAAGPWQVGLVVRDLASKTYDTVPTAYSPARHIDLNTQYRAGVAHITGHSTVALDVDLAENKGIGPRDATQFVALGGEYALKFFQLRAGYRANVASHSDVASVASAGIGIGPVDLAATVSSGTIGASLQIAFGW